MLFFRTVSKSSFHALKTVISPKNVSENFYFHVWLKILMYLSSSSCFTVQCSALISRSKTAPWTNTLKRKYSFYPPHTVLLLLLHKAFKTFFYSSNLIYYFIKCESRTPNEQFTFKASLFYITLHLYLLFKDLGQYIQLTYKMVTPKSTAYKTP